MRRTPTLCSALLLALTATLLAPVGRATATASAPAPAVTAVTAALAAPRAAAEATIAGAVRDRAGRYVDDVLVEALDRGTGETVASALTYENPDEGRRHGFFRLHVAKGTYALRFSSLEDADDPFRTLTLKKVRAKAGKETTVPVVTLTLQRKARTTTAAPTKVTGKVGRPVGLRVRVTSKDVRPVPGRVVVTAGRKSLGSARLTGRRVGRATVTLPGRVVRRLGAGTTRLTVTYPGTSFTKRSADRTKLVVRR